MKYTKNVKDLERQAKSLRNRMQDELESLQGRPVQSNGYRYRVPLAVSIGTVERIIGDIAELERRIGDYNKRKGG